MDRPMDIHRVVTWGTNRTNGIVYGNLQPLLSWESYGYTYGVCVCDSIVESRNHWFSPESLGGGRKKSQVLGGTDNIMVLFYRLLN